MGYTRGCLIYKQKNISKRVNALLWAIIDDGVNINTPAIKQSIEISEFGIAKMRTTTASLSHATICYSIVELYVKSIHPVISIKILDEETQRCQIGALVTAFNWCIENKIGLIHLSIGTIEPHHFNIVIGAIDRLVASGTVIVAANSNKGVQTYPAFDHRVISVECSSNLVNNQFIYTPNALNRVKYRASSRHNLRVNTSHATTPLSNSYAAPVITAEILNSVPCGGNISLNETHKLLQRKALCTDTHVLYNIPHVQLSAIIISITGQNEQTIASQMIELNKLLIRDGYTCSLLSDRSSSLHEVIVIPTGISLKKYLFWARRFYVSDVVIVALTSGNELELAKLSDLVISDRTVIDDDEKPLYSGNVLSRYNSTGDVKKTTEVYTEVLIALGAEEMQNN